MKKIFGFAIVSVMALVLSGGAGMAGTTSTSTSTSTSVSGANSNANNNNSNSNINVNAPGMAVAPGTCAGTISMGFGAPGIGLAFGAPVEMSGCKHNRDALTMGALGQRAVGVQVMCLQDDVNLAMAAVHGSKACKLHP